MHIHYSSEIWGLCSTKLFSEMLQKLPLNKKKQTHILTGAFHKTISLRINLLFLESNILQFLANVSEQEWQLYPKSSRGGGGQKFFISFKLYIFLNFSRHIIMYARMYKLKKKKTCWNIISFANKTVFANLHAHISRPFWPLR